MFGHVFGAPHGGEMATHYNGERVSPAISTSKHSTRHTAATQNSRAWHRHGTALIDDAYARIDDYTLVV